MYNGSSLVAVAVKKTYLGLSGDTYSFRVTLLADTP